MKVLFSRNSIYLHIIVYMLSNINKGGRFIYVSMDM